jgi:uncharacterized membrane protein YjdF
MNNNPSHCIINPWAGAARPQVIRNGHRNLGLLLEELAEWLDNGKVLGD